MWRVQKRVKRGGAGRRGGERISLNHRGLGRCGRNKSPCTVTGQVKPWLTLVVPPLPLFYFASNTAQNAALQSGYCTFWATSLKTCEVTFSVLLGLKFLL